MECVNLLYKDGFNIINEGISIDFISNPNIQFQFIQDGNTWRTPPNAIGQLVSGQWKIKTSKPYTTYTIPCYGKYIL